MCLNSNVIKYYGPVIPQDWGMSFKKLEGLPTVVAFWENLLPRQGQIDFWVWAPMSSVKCPTPLDVKFHWAQRVKGDYNPMEPIPIGEQ